MDLDEEVPQDEKLNLTQKYFLLSCPDALVPNKAAIKTEILAAVEEHGMVEWYRHFTADASPLNPRDDALVERMVAKNATKLEEIEAKIKDADENHGESEVRDAKMAKATFLDNMGDKAKALVSYEECAGEKSGATIGQRIDCGLAKIRLGLSFTDRELTAKSVKDCKAEIENGGDWERRNRLKVYEAVHLMSNREFKKAADLFLDSLATFTCTELISYNSLIFYTVICSIISLGRVQLKEKVLDAAEVLVSIDATPRLGEFLKSLYKCQYGTMFDAFPTIIEQLKTDRYLCLHAKHFEREMCVVAYTQFLESYRSVTLDSMATAFGVGVPWLDKELSRFIANSRINAKIDKVGGVVETNRPDAKNALYQDAIKDGDKLLNRIQKLSRVINV